MAQTIIMPKLGFDMAEGTLVRWVIQEGEPVAKGAILAEIETDKATVEVESAYSGTLARHLVQSGQVVPVSMPIALIAEPGEDIEGVRAMQPLVEGFGEQAGQPASPPPPPAGIETEAAPAPSAPEGQLPGGVRASPLARRMAEELGIDLKKVSGSGPGGRITKKDLQAYLMIPSAGAATPTSPPKISAAPAMPSPPSGEAIPLNRLRAIIGRRMSEAKQRIPHFYVTHTHAMEALLELRKQVNALLPEEERISVTDFLIKATALTLRQFPNLNASFQGTQIVRHSHINIGVAVSTEGGLLTVVCRDADIKPVRQIAEEMRLMIPRAREGKVRPEEIEGSTFSVSNLGMYDVENFIAIINPPEAAILAVGSTKEVPVVKDGQIVIGARMQATLSVDHRLSDGAEAARFLQALATFLEEPLRLLL